MKFNAWHGHNKLHLTIDDPVHHKATITFKMTDEESLELYRLLLDKLGEMYARDGDPTHNEGQVVS